jgi:AcrR family transcriptional regulator
VTTSDATSEASETLQRAHRPEQKQLRGTADQTPGKASSTASEAGDTFLRARRPEQKLQRREEILAAARELALLGGVRGVSLAGIAARAGIDKSALLRYFETREQIFLELTAREWGPWVRSLHDGLDGVAAGSADAAAGPPDAAGSADAAPGSPETADLVADVVARSFGDRPVFCDLLAHTPLNLERNVSPEAVRAYKLISLGAVGEAADVVHRALPHLTDQECREFISVIASLAGNLWQIANPVPALAAMFAADPALSLACIDLVPRLRRTGGVLLAGFIPSRRPPVQGLLASDGGAARRDPAALHDPAAVRDPAALHDPADGDGLELGQ